MSEKFTSKSRSVLGNALKIAQEMGHSYIGTEHILLALSREDGSTAAKLLGNRGITSERIKEEISGISGIGEKSILSPADMTPRVKHIIEISSYEALRGGQGMIGTEHILAALCSERDSIAVRILDTLGVSASEMYSDVTDFLSSADKTLDNAHRAGLSPRERSPLSKGSALAAYGRDLTRAAREGLIDRIIGRDIETERVIQILSRRSKNNPCLIGEPGVGKTAVIEGLAQRIADGNVPEDLLEKSIIVLDLPGMIAGAKYRGEFEERFKNVISEASGSSSVILFIDEIHNLIGAGAAEGAVDAANIIKPPLARGEIRLIGATTVSEYRKRIEKDAALERRFQPVMINEPTEAEAVGILRGLRQKYEEHHGLVISDGAIDAAVSLSVRYIRDRFLPDKAIDLLDEAASRLRISGLTRPSELRETESELNSVLDEKAKAIDSQEFELAAKLRRRELDLLSKLRSEQELWEARSRSGTDQLTAEHIAEVVTLRTGIPVNRLTESESDRLRSLEEMIKSRVIGQDEAVGAVCRAIRRGRSGLKDPRRPIGSFIFIGRTGVGKTELSRAVAFALFGNEKAMIRIDMSEYMEKHSISKLIGSPPGYIGFEDGGQLTEKVRRRPYSVILFDEIEKAHPDVFNILLQILDDGQLTDSQGRQVDFKNTIIILTSNLGFSGDGEKKILGFSGSISSVSDSDAKSRIDDALKRTFRPEFLNRVDDILYFPPLSRESVLHITRLMLNELISRVRKLGFDIEIQPSAVEFIANSGFDEKFGARPIRRAVTHLIEDPISNLLLDNHLPPSATLVISSDSSSVNISIRE